ncbi:hypothetical protein C5746_32460 [Streptomyces atratus]|uniref:Regulator of chromosome condensation (RCC1) repeat-containing protein n=1 Tax=Streptomyces atratus TaxID=1893 RepID=A0A2Z5JKN2_STRAR|nr:hypothetical protein C5746_32460 [Streptomyces atratus]
MTDGNRTDGRATEACGRAQSNGTVRSARTPARLGFRNTPQKVKDLTDVVSISVGCCHVLALTADGAVKSWGYNGFGQLGNDSLIDSNVPVDVLQLSAAAAVPAPAGPHRCVHGQRGARHGLRRRRQPHRHPAWQRRCPREGGRPQRDLGPGGRRRQADRPVRQAHRRPQGQRRGTGQGGRPERDVGSGG